MNPTTASDRQEATVTTQLPFQRATDETPRAFSAFTTYFLLGHNRSLQAVADKLGEPLQTVKNWSSRFEWNERAHQFNSGLLQKQIEADTEARRKAAGDWAQRTAEYREQEWSAAQKLLNVVQCCLENFGDRDLEKMRLSELSRALNVASKMSRAALQNTTAEDKPPISPLQTELLAALNKITDHPAPPPPGATIPTLVPNGSSINTQN